MLHNLLPRLQTEYIETEKLVEHFDWKPADAHPLHGKVSRTLESFIEQRTIVEKLTVFAVEKYPQEEPNKSYIERNFVSNLIEDGGSPLDEIQRGVSDSKLIQYDATKHRNLFLTHNTEAKYKDQSTILILKLLNWMPTLMDIFLQDKMIVKTLVVSAGQKAIK